MYHYLILTSRRDDFKNFVGGLTQHGEAKEAEVVWEISGEKALRHIAGGKTDVAVVDETLPDMTGIEWIRQAVRINPAVNAVAVSSLSAGDFHEATEGLGVLFQLPVHPDKDQAREVVNRLEKIGLHLRTPGPAAERSR